MIEASSDATKTVALPFPQPQPAPVPKPCDLIYPGSIAVQIDATDTDRGILRGHMTLPVAETGPMILLYPKWMPGYHSPQNPLEFFAGLTIKAGNLVLDWRRDPVEVYAFHIEVPSGTAALEIDFQFLSPTSTDQGDVVVTADILNLQWGKMLLYPSSYYSRGIEVQATVILPPGWSFATVLQVSADDGSTIDFEPVPLDVLVDSPLMAGRYAQDIPLDGDAVELSLFGHECRDLEISDDQRGMKEALVEQAKRLFASTHYDRYRFLVALSDELGGGGVEHHRSAEIVLPPSYFRNWEAHLPKRDVFAHEYTHSWNGKFRRAADSWTPNFEEPIRNSLMWVYEGQTQYWGHVLTARSGLWSTETALQSLAKVAATYDARPGGLWRTMADTTRDPVIAARALPWPSWQRSEDYYSEGQLLWLAVDTLIRERSGDLRSLDDFAAAFFGIEDTSMETQTYDFDDVVRTLDGVLEYDWGGLLTETLRTREQGAPLEGLVRGGYRLVYRTYRSDFCERFDAGAEQLDLRFSIGLNIGEDGTLQEVMWGSAAFEAGLTSGALIQQVNGEDFTYERILDAVDNAAGGTPIRLKIRARPQAKSRDVAVAYHSGHRFPHLEAIPDARLRLDEIFAPRDK